MGVGEDFAKFKDNYQITHEMVGSISYRYKRITRQLNADFRSNTPDTANPTSQLACQNDNFREF